jgi:transketolase
MTMQTMREVFTDVTVDLLDEDERVAVILADIGVARFAEAGAVERHPDRVVNVGIREQALVGVAAGFALEGMRPVVHSYAPFLVERPYEQIKLDFAHQGVGGVFVSIGGSYDAAGEGRTHQAPEDVALMATIPGMQIHEPGHRDELRSLLRRIVPGEGLHYVRLSETVNREARQANGRMTVVREAKPEAMVVIAVGPMLDRVLEATAGLEATVLYASTVRPFDAATLRRLAGTDVALVEPTLEGTSAAEVSRALADRPHRLLSIGVPLEEHRRYGTSAEHDRAHGLDAVGLGRAIRCLLIARPLPR